MPTNRTDTARLTAAGLNLIQQALSIYDRDLRLAVCNRRFQEMFDLPERLATPGADFAETIRFLSERGEYGPIDDVQAFVASRVEQARAFEPHYMERRRANGAMISVEGSPLPQGGWVAVYTDITSIKRQEALLRARSEELSGQLLAHAEQLAEANRTLAAANAALEQSRHELTEIEARTRMTAEMMPAHIAHLDLARRYTYSNRRLSGVIPGRPTEIVGLSASEVMGPEAYGKISPYLERAYRGEPSVFELGLEDSGRRVRVAFTPHTAADGGVDGVYILSMDITEEAQARAALTQTRKRELAARLTSGLAHDFANLLTIILGLQSRLERAEALPAAARELIAATRAAARRGGTLLDRLAAISGPREIRPSATDIAALLADTRALIAPSLPERVALITRTKDLDRPVLVDAGSLQDALINLILNARAALGEAPGRISLTARTHRDTWLEIIVKDTGPGFTDEALEHALDPFFTTKGEHGSGLGLSMVYDTTKLSGGTVRLANHPDGGAEVTLRLPLRFAERRAEPHLVLLVEDQDEIRQAVREMLVDLGHTVIEASTSTEAASLAALPGITLVLSDILLAGPETGLALLNRLKDRHLPAALSLMTSLPPADPLRAEAARHFPLISKPFDRAALAAFLTRKATP